jgi:hypothetical protein
VYRAHLLAANLTAHLPAQLDAHPCSAKIVGSDLAQRQIVASNSLSVSSPEDDSPRKTQKDTKDLASIDLQRGPSLNPATDSSRATSA